MNDLQSAPALAPAPQPPRRTAFIGALDRAIRLGRGLGLMDRANLEADALLGHAMRATGLDDFGDPWFRQPLDVLLQSLREEAQLNAAGEFAAEKQFHKVLKDRLWAQMWFKRHPEILDRAIPRPVVIVGPMRSGTTRLHRLLASDQRFTHMRSFETISPVPQPDFEEVLAGRRKDQRPAVAARIKQLARLANPRTLSIHPTGPFEPEEELGLLVSSMWGMKHEAQWQIPFYGRWCEGRDAEPAYRHMANLLRLVGWSQQASSIRPWLLKTPQHMLDLPALLKVFPDARLIFSHRDPQAIVGSAASLAWNQTIIYSDHADANRVGREWLHKTELQIARMRAARDQIPRDRMIDVQYDDMDRDWRGTMERIYHFLGLDIEPAWAGMERFVERSQSLKRHPHRYSLAEFGLSAGEVAERLGDYVGTYGIPVESDIGHPRQPRSITS